MGKKMFLLFAFLSSPGSITVFSGWLSMAFRNRRWLKSTPHKAKNFRLECEKNQS